MDGWNTILSYWDGLFSGAFAVSFREGNQVTFPKPKPWYHAPPRPGSWGDAEQASQWSSVTFLIISNNSNLKHPPISYPFSLYMSKFQADTNWDIQKKFAKKRVPMDKIRTTPKWTWQVIPLFGRLFSQFYFIFSQVKNLFINKIIITYFHCFCGILTESSSKWSNWKSLRLLGTLRFWIWLAHLHGTETLQLKTNMAPIPPKLGSNKKWNNPGPLPLHFLLVPCLSIYESNFQHLMNLKFVSKNDYPWVEESSELKMHQLKGFVLLLNIYNFGGFRKCLRNEISDSWALRLHLFFREFGGQFS